MGVEAKQFDGDISVGRNAAIGGDAKVVGGMTVGRSLKVEGWLEAKNIKDTNKGLFVDLFSLKKAYPVPQDGWWALVGTTLPANVYVAKDGDWVYSGGTGGEITVESQQIEALIERFEDEMQSMRDVNETQTNNIVALSNATNTNASEISTLKNKDVTHDSKISKLEERVLQYLYPKIYQLNEGAGARKFDGFTEAEGIGGLLLTKDTYQYSVLYSTTQKAFILNVTDEVSGQGVRVGTFNIWPKIEGKGIASSESYAERDILFYIHVHGDGSTYYYIDNEGNAVEASATYLLRLLVDKNAAEAKAADASQTARLDSMEVKVKELGAFDTFAALFARAAKFDIVSNNAIALLHGTYKKTEDIYHGVLILQQVEKNNNGGGTAMQYIYIEKRQYTRYIDFSATAVTGVQSVQNHGARNLSLSNRVLQLKNMWDKNVGSGVTLPDNGNLYEGTAGTTTVPVVMAKTFGGIVSATLGAATSARAGVMTVSHVNRIDKLEERVLQYLYPKIYQLNEGAGARVFHGFTKATGEGGLIITKDTYRYSVLYSTTQKQFVLNVTDEASGAGVRVGTFTFWPKISLPNNKSIDSSESYALRDCLYYIYVEGEGSTYYYIDSNGVASEQSATYLLRRLVDKNASSIAAASGTANDAKATAEAAKATADAASTAAQEANTTATDAQAEASEAKATADAAKLTAAEAKTNAGSARSIAQGAVLTANAAKATADGIAATAQEAKDIAEATKSELVEVAGSLGEEDNRLNGLIAENKAKISSVESTATQARDTAVSAQTAAETAQSTATAAQTKNTEQDARLEKIENSVSHLSYAGRYWNEANGTPTAAGHYGSLDALRSLPEMLGLGRYLVKDDRTRRKLDPKDSTKYADDGTDAKLDGTEGQCMWCWNGFYANVWKEGDNLFKVVSFYRPVGNDISIWIPAGGISWLGAGVIDRGEAPYTDKTKWKLCSVINNSEQFRGGDGTAIDATKHSSAPADTTPQITMLGMPATMISTTDFGNYARKRGEGWEANWFVARFVVEFLFEVIMGTENSQEAFNANKDANGLYQGGFGTGVTDMSDWGNYNGTCPLIPTSVGLEAGDGVCLVPYNLPDASGGTYKTFNAPVFFGLVGAGFGNLWQLVRGLIMNVGEEQSLVYVSPSMYAAYNPSTVEDKIMVAECPRVYGWIMRKSYKGLCCMPTKIDGSATLRYSDNFYTNVNKSNGLLVRAAGGTAAYGESSGASSAYVYYLAKSANRNYSAPLCYFDEDPVIPETQSIANN